MAALMVVICLLPLSLITVAQQSSQDQSRPRRVEAETTKTDISMSQEPEPMIRVGLATSVRSAAISTNGSMKARQGFDAASTLATNRVRVESRLLGSQPIQPSGFQVEIAGAATRGDADRAVTEIRAQTAENSQVVYDQRSNTFRIRVGRKMSKQAAEALRDAVEEIGFPMASVVADVPAASETTAKSPTVGAASSGVRPVARTTSPTRAAIVYASGAAMLFSSYAPVTFSSDGAPVRFNDKPYRGSIEVFANPGGTLTVVNVVGLEDYLKGVVPNELSPGSYNQIEAHKAQAIAARTYALKNRNGFASQGFDLLPTTRSQVYGGLATEHPFSSRAVDETRGIIATYNGEPINALYTSTCGGRTENSENIFIRAEPYLRGRECSVESRVAFAPFTIRSTREPADIRDEANALLARSVALLAVHDFPLPNRINDAWLAAATSPSEVRGWLATAARAARQPSPSISDDVNRPGPFSAALATILYGQAYADTLLDSATIDYLLNIKDASELSAHDRADVALLLRDGILNLFADATLRPKEIMSRGRVLHTLARGMEIRGKLTIQKATTRPSTSTSLVLRSTSGRDQPIAVKNDAFLFRTFADAAYQMRSVIVVGGEPVTFHVNSGGEIDYLEVRPASSGASAERFSPFTNWTATLTLAQAQTRLAKYSPAVGSLMDLRIAATGWSRRATDLEVIGTRGKANVRGGRIRSALGLREQLFFIEKNRDQAGRVVGFTFIGRGWGHGVGLCQVGAYGLARAGLTYDKILKAYYSSIEITKVY